MIVNIGVRGGGGEGEEGVNHLSKKNFRKLRKFLRHSRKETRVIRCTNMGLHMK